MYVVHKLGEHTMGRCEGDRTYPDERIESQIPRVTQLTPDGRPPFQRGARALDRSECGLKVLEGLEEAHH